MRQFTGIFFRFNAYDVSNTRCSMSEMLVLEAMDYQHNTKDRPLGQTKLDVKQLVAQGPDRKEQPYVSTVAISRSVNLQTDNGKAVKGTLIYEASFFPAVPLRGVAFAEPTSPLTKVMPQNTEEVDDNASIIEPDAEDTVDAEDELSQQMNAEIVQASAPSHGPDGAPSTTERPSQGSNAAMTRSVSGKITGEYKTESVTEGVALSREDILSRRT